MIKKKRFGDFRKVLSATAVYTTTTGLSEGKKKSCPRVYSAEQSYQHLGRARARVVCSRCNNKTTLWTYACVFHKGNELRNKQTIKIQDIRFPHDTCDTYV